MANKSRGGVEDTRLEAKDTKKTQGQGQTLSRPRTGKLEAKAKDTGARVLQKKKKEKVFKKILIFLAISSYGEQKRPSQIFCEVARVFQQNFNASIKSAVLEPRARQFSRTWDFEAKAKGLTFEAKDALEDYTSEREYTDIHIIQYRATGQLVER